MNIPLMYLLISHKQPNPNQQKPDSFFYWILLIISLLLFVAIFIGRAKAETSPAIWKVLLAEGANQGYSGMYAIACVIRNRGGDLRGFAGTYRKDLDAFCNRQGKKYIEMAKRVEIIVFKNNGKDITNGATHFESTNFPKPKWAYKMREVYRYKKHIFYKLAKLGEK